MATNDYKIKARLQKDWNWMVAVYLFLGGVGSGAYVVGAIAGFIGWPNIAKVGIVISLPAVLIGSLFLMAHLGTPGHSYLAPSRMKSSWISRGVLFLSLFMLFSFIHIIDVFTGVLGGAVKVISVIALMSAVGTMVYTGALLSASKGVPFWRSGIMPILFMFSALVTGLSAVLVIAYAGFSSSIPDAVSLKLALTAIGLLVGEAIIVFFFLHSALRLPESRDPAIIMMQKASFIYGDLIFGLLVPFVLMLIVTSLKGGGSTPAYMIVAGILALLGGMLLRFAIISVGMVPSLNISGFEFRLQTKPTPKPAIGKVPPGNI